MKEKLVFIYDGQCPFCNHFAELLELKSDLPNISFLNGRHCLQELTNLYAKGYDLDKGAILLKDGEILHGANAIYWICSNINEPSDQLLRMLAFVFSSNRRTYAIFPFLLIARRVLLTFRGIPRKMIS